MLVCARIYVYLCNYVVFIKENELMIALDITPSPCPKCCHPIKVVSCGSED